MQPSRNLIAFIEKWEAFRAHAYLPTHNDVPTIGFGETGHDIHLGMVWTLEYATFRLQARVLNFSHAVDGLLAGVATTQAQFDAMVSLAYNIGAVDFAKSTLLACHRRGDYVTAAAQFGRWVHQGPDVLAGLVARRAAEAAVYEGKAL